MNTDIDHLLFDKVRNRDKRAFDELMRRYSEELYHFILRTVQNSEDARDILQDTFVRVWEKSYQFKGNSSVKTWIYRIAINLSYSHLRRQKRWRFTFLDDIKVLLSSANPEKDTETNFHRNLLRDGLETLTPRQQAVVMARIYEDMPYAELAEGLGCSVNAAKVHYHEGKKRLEEYFTKKVGNNG